MSEKTHQEKLEAVIAKIVEAVPEIMEFRSSSAKGIKDGGYFYRDITLEDVMISVMKIKNKNQKYFYNTYEGRMLIGNWGVGKPLHKQGKELINFLHDILL